MNLEKLVSKFGKCKLNEPATKDQIESFEKKNKVKLPQKYKEWLLFSDGGHICLPAGIQFYGVLQKPQIDISSEDRPNDTYVVIGALATGDPILFKKDTEQVAIYNQEINKIENDEIYDDFFKFISDYKNILGLEG